MVAVSKIRRPERWGGHLLQDGQVGVVVVARAGVSPTEEGRRRERRREDAHGEVSIEEGSEERFHDAQGDRFAHARREFERETGVFG